MCKLKKIGSAKVYWLILGLGILAVSAISARDAQSFSDNSLNIRITSNLVTVPVSVTDAAGNSISTLQADDFRIQEDGRAETIAKMADAGESPLQMALLFDLSGSLNALFEFEQHAAIRFLEKVWKRLDTVTIVVFNEKADVRLRDCRSLPDALNVLQKLQPTESSTAFFDSVIMGARLMRQATAPETRRSVIVLSDGEDNRSDSRAADALHEFQQSDAIFYSINPSGASVRLNAITMKGQQDMSSIASETGGTAFVSDTGGHDLERIFGQIANELRSQYLLSYYSSNPRSDHHFRRITVSLPNKPDLRIHARQGYYLSANQSNN
jgi:Ca-activated chloride channel homolog